MPDRYKFLYKIPADVVDKDYHHKKNIVNAAAEIFRKLVKYDEVLTAAEMQSGKTDVMKRVIHVIQKFNSEIKDLGINIEKYNIYLIICASSLNLKNQLKDKLPEIRHRIYHLNDVALFLKNLYEHNSLLTSMADSSLIIFDECHCDAETGKLIDKFRSAIDKLAKENKTTYHKLGFSASPYEQVIAKHPKVIMKPGPDYYGLGQMFKANKNIPLVFQAKDLSDETECANLFSEIELCNYYYIFRLPGKKMAQDAVMTNIEKQFKLEKSSLDTYIYDMNYKGNINEILDIKPKKPTVIYLKDKLRMGEYLNTKYVYLVHDDPNNMYTHTTIQSLIGRCCGYNKKPHQTIIYCDYNKALEHCKWIKYGYDCKHIPADCKYVKKNGAGTKNICIY